MDWAEYSTLRARVLDSAEGVLEDSPVVLSIFTSTQMAESLIFTKMRYRPKLAV